MKTIPQAKVNKGTTSVRSAISIRTSNLRTNKITYKMTSTAIVPGKLADESQMGGLSSLLTSSPLSVSVSSVSSSNLDTSLPEDMHVSPPSGSKPSSPVELKPPSPVELKPPLSVESKCSDATTIMKPPKKRFFRLQKSFSEDSSIPENGHIQSQNEVPAQSLPEGPAAPQPPPESVNNTAAWNADTVAPISILPLPPPPPATSHLESAPLIIYQQNSHDPDMHYRSSWNSQWQHGNFTNADAPSQVLPELAGKYKGAFSYQEKSLDTLQEDDTDVVINLSNHNFEIIKVSQQEIIEKAVDKFCGLNSTKSYRKILPLIKHDSDDQNFRLVPDSYIKALPQECNNNVLLSANLPQIDFTPNRAFSWLECDARQPVIAAIPQQVSVLLPQNYNTENTVGLDLSSPASEAIYIVQDHSKETSPPVKMSDMVLDCSMPKSLNINIEPISIQSCTKTGAVDSSAIIETHVSSTHPPNSLVRNSTVSSDFLFKKRIVKKYINDGADFTWNNALSEAEAHEVSDAGIENKTSNLNYEVSCLTKESNLVAEAVGNQSNVQNENLFFSSNNSSTSKNISVPVSFSHSATTEDLKVEENEGKKANHYSEVTGSSRRKISVKRAQMFKQENFVNSNDSVKTGRCSAVSDSFHNVSTIVQRAKENVKLKKRPRAKTVSVVPPRETSDRACKGMKYRQFIDKISSGRQSKKNTSSSLPSPPADGPHTFKENGFMKSYATSSGSDHSVKSTTCSADTTLLSSSSSTCCEKFNSNADAKDRPSALMTISFILAAAGKESPSYLESSASETQKRKRLTSSSSCSSERTDSVVSDGSLDDLPDTTNSYEGTIPYNKTPQHSKEQKTKYKSNTKPQTVSSTLELNECPPPNKKLCMSRNFENRRSLDSDSGKSTHGTYSSSLSSPSASPLDASVVETILASDTPLDTLAAVAAVKTRIEDNNVFTCQLEREANTDSCH